MNGLVACREQSQDVVKILNQKIHKINDSHGAFFGNIIVSEDRMKSLPWPGAQNCISITKEIFDIVQTMTDWAEGVVIQSFPIYFDEVGGFA